MMIYFATYIVIHVKPIRLQMYQIPPESAKWRVYRAQTDSIVRPIWIEMLYFICASKEILILCNIGFNLS